jgi:nucleoside-diphosphate-sugar epimerase
VLRVSGPPQSVSIVHARDLAEGILLAATNPAARGRTYYLAHPAATTWPEIAGWAAAALGARPRAVAVPRGLIPAISRASGFLNALAGRENPLPADRLADLLAPAWTCSPARAERELGFRAVRDHAVGIAEAVAAWRARGTGR